MKYRLLFRIIFAFIFSSCSDFSGNEDAVEASLKPAPVTRNNNNNNNNDTPTRTYYDLDAITFGNNTFVAVGERGTVRTSSDNGTTWDNGTSGTTKQLNEIGYGNSTFVAVGQSGPPLYSSNNGSTWGNGTWSESDWVTGVAFGNNTFIGVSSTYLTKSTDNGANWSKKAQGIAVWDVTYGNSKFVASGANGAIQHSSNDGENWTNGNSRTTEET